MDQPRIAVPALSDWDATGHSSCDSPPRGSSTIMTSCRFELPLQVRVPSSTGRRLRIRAVAQSYRRRADGDRLSAMIELGPQTRSCLSTPSATRTYKLRVRRRCSELTQGLLPVRCSNTFPICSSRTPAQRFTRSWQLNLSPAASRSWADGLAAGWLTENAGVSGR